jgi:hypothetical protein
MSVNVTVSSPYPANLQPFSGTQPLPKGVHTFSVDHQYLEEKQLGGWLNTKWKKTWTCTGWTGTGDIPEKGVGNSVTFDIQNNSSITWIWASENQIGAQAVSICIFAAVISIALAGYYLFERPFIVAIFAGALGGLIHEIIKNGGKYVLPNVDEKGNLILGGLVGLLTGGVAGLLMYQGLLGGASISVDAKLAVESILAGLAVKGVADAAKAR